jgi:protein-tyrosine phosphatase
LPHEVFIDPEPVLDQLAVVRIRVIISHPERNTFLSTNPDRLNNWQQYDPCLQVTAASLLGHFGPTAQEMGWAFLQQAPCPILVATDAHDTGPRRPYMAEAFGWIRNLQGELAAREFCIDNPRKVIEGEELPSWTELEKLKAR